ncbi:hypothetical protein LCGC14_1796530 [marine sediment metagenome]|uniref:Uncharacterized protein n=1 Tax=marine sediment metagenome TaxID=412755 RepID=A0A0F9HDL5_9ZZZZ
MALKKFTEGSFIVKYATSHFTVGELVDVTLTTTIAPGDVTRIGTTWESVVELGRSWEMAISMNYDPANSAQSVMISAYVTGPASFSDLQFFEDGTGNHSGTALLTSAVVTKAVGSVDKFTATFKGDSTLGYT